MCGEQALVTAITNRTNGSSLRVRGTAIVVTDHNIQHGSSLRVRGTVMGVTLGGILQRVIPACAGNSPA